MDMENAKNIGLFLALIVSLSVHEFFHAYVAKIFGDRTAEEEGRLTLNPIPHIDPVGTLLLPGIAIFMGTGILGWAKPVPVDTSNFKNPRKGMLFTSLAGPLSNFLLTILSAAALIVVNKQGGEAHLYHYFLESMVIINAILGFFNAFPFPPLDGAAIIKPLLPRKYANYYEQYIEPYGFMILVMMAISGGFHWVHKAASVYVGIVISWLGIFL